MAHTGQQILDRARIKANDTYAADYTWTDAEALLWVNDAQRAVVSKLPKANTVSAFATLAAGSRQTLSGLSLTGGIEFIDVVCNVSGTTRGKPVHKTARAHLDDEVPTWHTDTGTDVEYWCLDERDPKAIYIWPQVTSGKLEVIYAATPTDLGSLAGSIGLDDIYAEAMQFYVLHCFFSKDITKLKAAHYAQFYYQMFLQVLGVRDESITLNADASTAKEQGA